MEKRDHLLYILCVVIRSVILHISTIYKTRTALKSPASSTSPRVTRIYSAGFTGSLPNVQLVYDLENGIMTL